MLGSLPWLDAFGTERGRKTVLTIATFSGFLIVFFYSIDYAHYSYLSQRLNASILNYLADAGISVSMVWQTYPVVRMILILLAGSLIFYWLSKKIYARIATPKSRATKKKPHPLVYHFTFNFRAWHFWKNWPVPFAMERRLCAGYRL